MDYQTLYRKWRPVRFDDVCGQEHITQTLKNQIDRGRVGNAYLFTGTRGTGKTTCAKIFAKAVNCLDPKDGEPCGKCANCVAVESDSLFDILEIDAASKSRVEDIRSIIDEVIYAPSVGLKKVYIIDEVQMMTGNAFNALLKTLEEPPNYVVFILATTEVHKVPGTILSRCQRFDFKRLSTAVITNRLIGIARAEGIELDESGARFIAVLADGSMRDALSILEQCSTCGHVTAQTVSDIVGVAPVSDITGIISCAADGDAAGALKKLDTLYNNSHRMDTLLTGLIECMRDIMMINAGAAGIVNRSDEDIASIKDVCPKVSDEFALFCIQTLADASARVTVNSANRTVAEIALIRMCNPDYSDTPAALSARLERLERMAASGALLAATATAQTAAEAAPNDGKRPANVEQSDEVEPEAPAVISDKSDEQSEKAGAVDADSDLLSRIKAAIPRQLVRSYLGGAVCRIDENRLTINVNSQLAHDFLGKPENFAELKKIIEGILGGGVSPVIEYTEDKNDKEPEDIL